MSTLDEKKGRLFSTLVLMGGALTLGCGGVAQEPASDEPLGTGGTNATGGESATGGSGGISLGTGGSATGGTGGLWLGTGGSLPDTITPGPFVCPPEQWECAVSPYQCTYNEHLDFAFELPGNCLCNPEKPLTAADCAADESFVCLGAVADSEGRLFDRFVNFACRCVPKAEYCEPCYDVTATDGVSCREYPTEADPTAPVVCDCAIPTLK